MDNQPKLSQTQTSQTKLDKKTILFFEPDRDYKSVGDSFTINVMINTELEKVSGVEFYINYDQTKLEVEKISPGNFFERPNILINNVSVNKIDNNSGKIVYAIGALSPKKGQGSIAIIKFKVIDQTNLASLAFAPETKVAAIGYHESVLTSTKEAQYTLLNN